jgi:hypothetical protein
MPILTWFFHGALAAQLAAAPYPFAVGERLEYEATLGVLPVGTATITVNPMAQERGLKAFVFAASGEGRPLGIRMGAQLTSYVGQQGFNSLRFNRRVFQGGSVEEAQFQIVPDSSRYRMIGDPRDWAAPSDPLDELAFLYYLRTIPLKPGGSYSIPRYFKTGYNPVQVRVVGRESRQLPDGRSAPVLTLEVTSRGMTMGVALTDDARRLPVELDLPLPIGQITLSLTRAG